VDFFIPSIRLAIEIDGRSHDHPVQRAKDRIKEVEAYDLSITMLRLSNNDVWGKEKTLEHLFYRAVDQAEYRVLSSLGPLSLPFSSHNTAAPLIVRDARREWQNLPDFSPKPPSGEVSMTAKYRKMKFAHALVIDGVMLYRQCLNPKCNYEKIIPLQFAISEEGLSEALTAESLEAKSVCSKCKSHFVLCRLGAPKL
jgi:hypothetical protein